MNIQDKSAEGNLTALVSWSIFDWANSSYSAIIETFVFATFFAEAVAASDTEGLSLWGFITGLAGLFVAIGGPILGAIADRCGLRKLWIAFFTVITITCISLMWFVKPHPTYVIFAMVLTGFAAIASEYSYVFYNAMLPELSGSKNVGKWSGIGWGLGYLGGMMSLLIAYFGFIKPDPWFAITTAESANIRATFLVCAAWYALFSLPLFFFTPPSKSMGIPIGTAVKQGLLTLWGSLKNVRENAPLFRFFIARMFFVDGLLTLFAFGGVYAATQYHMSSDEILRFGIALNITAGIGAMGFAFLDDRVGGKEMIIISLAALIFIGTMALLAKTSNEFWTYGMLLGIFVGPAQASSRSYLARVVPPDMRNQMFGFFALTGKATAFMGPILVAWITYMTQNERLGMSVVIVFLVIGALLMLSVPSDRKPIVIEK